MANNKWFWLQLFAGEGGAAAGGASAGGDGSGAGAETGVTDDAAAGHKRLLELGVPENKIRKNRAYRTDAPVQKTVEAEQPSGEKNKSEQAAAAEDGPTEEKTDTKETKASARMSWDEIMADPDYNKQMQAVIKARLKNAGAAEETLAKMAPALEVLARKHGLDPENPDYEALAKAINDDDVYYEDKALEMGVSVEAAKRIDQQERDTARKQKEEERNLEQQRIHDHFVRLEREGEALKKVYPSFDLRTELQNPAFARMVAPGQGIMSVEDAYNAVHRKEIEAARSQVIAQQTTQKISNAIQAGYRRPEENGTSGQSASVTTFDYSKASKAQREDLKKQIRSAAARGEKLYPGMR